MGLSMKVPVSNQLLAVTEDASVGSTNHKLGDFTGKNTSANDMITMPMATCFMQ